MQDVISDIKVIEEDLENVEQKCEKVNCNALYDAIIATIKLIKRKRILIMASMAII